MMGSPPLPLMYMTLKNAFANEVTAISGKDKRLYVIQTSLERFGDWASKKRKQRNPRVVSGTLFLILVGTCYVLVPK